MNSTKKFFRILKFTYRCGSLSVMKKFLYKFRFVFSLLVYLYIRHTKDERTKHAYFVREFFESWSFCFLFHTKTITEMREKFKSPAVRSRELRGILSYKLYAFINLTDYYRATSMERDSRMTFTLISPGYLSSFSTRRAMSRAIFLASRSLICSGVTKIRISRPAWRA